MVREAVINHGFRSLKIHGHEAMPTREVCDAARESGCQSLSMSPVRRTFVDMFAPQYPEISVHHRSPRQLGVAGAPTNGSSNRWLAIPTYWAIRGRPAIRLPGAGDQTSPSSKLLFGSDGPWLHPAVELHKIRLLGLSRRAQARFSEGMRAACSFNRKQRMSGVNWRQPERIVTDICQLLELRCAHVRSVKGGTGVPTPQCSHDSSERLRLAMIEAPTRDRLFGAAKS